MCIFTERLAGLDLAGRREGYAGTKFVPLSEIPTWKQQYKENQKSLLEMVKGKDMSGAMKGLADKVSLFRGDITKLEVIKLEYLYGYLVRKRH